MFQHYMCAALQGHPTATDIVPPTYGGEGTSGVSHMVTVKASLPPEARKCLTEMLDAEGLTLGAFLQAVTEAADARGKPPKLDTLVGTFPEILDRARAIMAERRKR